MVSLIPVERKLLAVPPPQSFDLGDHRFVDFQQSLISVAHAPGPAQFLSRRRREPAQSGKLERGGVGYSQGLQFVGRVFLLQVVAKTFRTPPAVAPRAREADVVLAKHVHLRCIAEQMLGAEPAGFGSDRTDGQDIEMAGPAIGLLDSIARQAFYPRIVQIDFGKIARVRRAGDPPPRIVNHRPALR